MPPKPAGQPKAPPATDLQNQLQQLAVSQHVDQGRRHLGKASLLYTFQEAADIDVETIYRVGLEGEQTPDGGLGPPSSPAAAAAALLPAAACRHRLPLSPPTLR